MYEVLDDLYDYCFPILDKIGFKLESIDEEIGDAGQGAKELVRDIHKVKQEIISYRKIIKPQRPTLRQLERQVERFLPEDLELYFDDIVDASERIWDLLDNYKEVVEALEDTNESLISHQQNDILYVLTIFSVVMLPLTFLTGFFGMNVGFPGIDQPSTLLRGARALRRRARRHARLLPLQALALMERLWAPWRLEYVQHADAQDGCVFCRAAAAGGDEDELVVHRGAHAFVLLNKFPYASGHLLVAPYRHGAGFDGPRRRRGARAAPAGGRRGSRRCASVYGPEGFNVGWNLGRIAGAGIVDHGHVHVVPRWAGDTNFMPVLADVRVIPEHLRESRRRLAGAWPDVGRGTKPGRRATVSAASPVATSARSSRSGVSTSNRKTVPSTSAATSVPTAGAPAAAARPTV